MSEGTQATGNGEGNYIYCIADSGESVSLGKIGIAGEEVYTISHKDICAVVHDCGVEPYQSGDREVVTDWVVTHQRVIDAAWQKWGVVLPSAFDSIVKGEPERGARENLQRWLEEEYEGLKQKMEKVRGKAEYGIQVFWNPKVIAQDVAATSADLRRLEEEIRAKPRGSAYLLRQRVENLLRNEMEARADQYFRECYGRIRKHVADLRVEKTKKADAPNQMLLNLSCLVSAGNSVALGEELGEIDAREGFSVRFTGPWPPYSFVGSA